MPFRPIWSGPRTVGGRYRGGSTSPSTPINQSYGPANPRAPAPAKPSQLQTSGKVIVTESQALSGTISQGQPYNLPTIHDITGLQFTVQLTSATGSGSVTLDWANLIDHIVIRNRNGTPFDTIQFRSPDGVGGLLPTLYEWQTLFRPQTPTSVATNTIAAATLLTSVVTSLSVYGIRCAAEDGPWSVETWYNTVSGFGGSGVSAATVSNRVRALFGNAGGPDGRKYNSKFAYQTIPTTGTGDYHLETQGIVKNTYINQLILNNMSTLTNLDHIVVNSHGQNVDTNLSEQEIKQAMTDQYYGAFGSKCLVPTAALNTQFTIGDSDELILNMGTSLSNVQVNYQYLLPAGGAK